MVRGFPSFDVVVVEEEGDKIEYAYVDGDKGECSKTQWGSGRHAVEQILYDDGLIHLPDFEASSKTACQIKVVLPSEQRAFPAVMYSVPRMTDVADDLTCPACKLIREGRAHRASYRNQLWTTVDMLGRLFRLFQEAHPSDANAARGAMETRRQILVAVLDETKRPGDLR